jgi:transcriptional regulator with XRE-family HTH domain
MMRREASLSQEQLAEMAEVHPTYVSRIERGVVNPSILVLQRIAKAAGGSLRDLIP